MGFILFSLLVIATGIAGVFTVFFLFKWEKYGGKKLLISFASLIILLAITIPLGQRPVVDEVTEDEVDRWYEENIAPKQTEKTGNNVQEVEENVKPKVTKAVTNQITEGMTYEEVINIIGYEGVLEKERRMSYGIHTAYKWENEDGSYAFIQFEERNTGTPVVVDFIFSDLK
ncbi:hypothetical protein [Mesobacillus jeotgali]|uniref:hypothetical protein n=1 Tax=Mesobacillus jeotgali TaxID=129985 RepID=UPI001CFD4D39|nr:hypothetical protein [Mesobacillus jeotgali]